MRLIVLTFQARKIAQIHVESKSETVQILKMVLFDTFYLPNLISRKICVVASNKSDCSLFAFAQKIDFSFDFTKNSYLQHRSWFRFVFCSYTQNNQDFQHYVSLNKPRFWRQLVKERFTKILHSKFQLTMQVIVELHDRRRLRIWI